MNIIRSRDCRQKNVWDSLLFTNMSGTIIKLYWINKPKGLVNFRVKNPALKEDFFLNVLIVYHICY